MSEMLDHALAYAKLGWRLVPIHHINGEGRCTCLREDCPAPGKHPRLKDWLKHATADEKVIRGMWARWPDANIGMAMGQGFVDIETEADCADSLARLEEKLGPLPDTVSWTSGGGGLHRLFRTALPIRNLTNVGRELLGVPKTGIDVRGEGGQAVMPPSAHISGGTYRWTNLTPDAIEVAELPETWAKHLAEASKPAPLPSAEARPAMTAEELQAVEPRAIAYLDAMPPAVSGEGGHDATYAAATALVHGFGLPAERALALLLERYNARCQPPWDEKDLRHKVEDAAAKPHTHPFGWLRDQGASADEGVDLSGILGGAPAEPEPPGPPDPGPLPEHLLHVPGLVARIMDFTLATAPYPDRVLAFCGALALQAALCARKVRDHGGTRTSLYLLGLANSGTGKDHPRKVNQRIMLEAGIASQLADNFASGEGIEDRVAATKNVLFQTDEIDAVLLAISRSRDGRAERIMEILLKLYSAANQLYHLRVKAGQEPQTIDQPGVTLFGTAIPKHFYESHCEKMLTNGFFARMLVFEAGLRGPGQEPRELPVPADIVEEANYWAALRPGHGNLDNEHPCPIEVPYGPGVVELYAEIRARENDAYNAAAKADDAIAMAIWARAGEKARRLALVRACSEDYRSPLITREAVEWAWAIVEHQTRQMLFQAGSFVAKNDFDSMCKELIRVLREWKAKNGDEPMPEWQVNRKLSWKPRDHEDVRRALEDQERIRYETVPTKTKPKHQYWLLA